MLFQTLYSLCVPADAKEGETPVHRYPTAIDRPLTSCAPPDVRTVYDALLHRIKLEPDKQTMGQRPVLSRRTDHLRHGWTYLRLGAYEWMTYREIGQLTRELGSGLAQLAGMDESGAVGRMLIYAPTSREWSLCMLACYSQGLQVVTAYDTLGDQGVVHAMNETAACAAFVRADQLPTIERIAGQMRTCRTVVYHDQDHSQDHSQDHDRDHDQDGCCSGRMPKGAEAAIGRLRAAGIRVLSMEEAVRLGRQHPRDLHVAGGDDTALVMYTSGTTGPPKGVLIAHSGVLAVCGAIHELVPDYIDMEADRVLSYLPLSHVLAFFVETYCIYSGIRIGYGSPRTLTEDSLEPGCLGDIRELQPAVMLGVPQVWNTIRASILRQVARRPWIIQQLFHGAVELKTCMVRLGLPTWLLDAVVFRKTRLGTGGRLKIAITGGAQINSHVQKFIAAAVCPMLHGYGLSEASGLVCVQIPGDTSLGNIGPPVPSVEIKLVDVPDSAYCARDGQGEIWVRGPSVFRGYLNDPEATCRALTPDGWLRTGDIGQWTAAGQLAIVDRRKNLVKLVTGEYVALEALESAYCSSPLVANICVFADARMARPCAIVNIDPAAAARPHCNDVSLVIDDLARVARINALGKHQTLADIRIDPELWTPENGMLTAASKLRRAVIAKHNSRRLDEMYHTMGLSSSP